MCLNTGNGHGTRTIVGGGAGADDPPPIIMGIGNGNGNGITVVPKPGNRPANIKPPLRRPFPRSPPSTPSLMIKIINNSDDIITFRCLLNFIFSIYKLQQSLIT